MFARVVIFAFAALTVVAAEDRITGTAPAANQNFVVSIRYNRGRHICSGVIVSTSQVITTAYCVAGFVSNPSQLSVRTFNLPTPVESVVDLIQIHPNYQKTTRDYDIAKITIFGAFPADINNALPTIAINQTRPIHIIGWNSGQSAMQRMTTTYMTPAACRLAHLITDRMICTNVGGGVCRGDEGSALVQGRRLIGILSWTHVCQSIGPVMYTYLGDRLICLFVYNTCVPVPQPSF